MDCLVETVRSVDSFCETVAVDEAFDEEAAVAGFPFLVGSLSVDLVTAGLEIGFFVVGFGTAATLSSAADSAALSTRFDEETASVLFIILDEEKEMPFREFDLRRVALLNLEKCEPGSFGERVTYGFDDASVVSAFFAVAVVLADEEEKSLPPLFDGLSESLKQKIKLEFKVNKKYF
jgi:hypothetical protein